MLDFVIWLSETEWSIALHESLYLYPWIESTHVLSICLFFGTLLFVDLRLSGVVFNNISISEMNRKVLPLTLFGFLIMTVTGFLLFYAIPVRSYQNIFFRIKMLLIVFAGINAFLFHRRMSKEAITWDINSSIPNSMKNRAITSLVLWATVVITGRMIAYNWFDCDMQPQPKWINTLTSCEVDYSLFEGIDGF
ncbi:MAG TPA: DUF6644 family protein [SAR86 cluster bacterium]|jgi:uncharacterized membrane protein|nr:DUF6644 family protein [SAR86 cluster bacterium]|tara:strand:- start:5575 stop:6153 length:579 start_codon:yes stop_codon:yes gene_type:complete